MNSAQKIIQCFQKSAEDYGLDHPSAAFIDQQIGLSLENVWLNIFRDLSIISTPELLEGACDRYRDYFLEIDQTPMPLYGGVEQGLQTLEDAGYLLNVATGKARRG